jgi:hypothetical protein
MDNEKKLKILNFYLKEETITKLSNCQMNLNPLSNEFLQTGPFGSNSGSDSNLESGIRTDTQVQCET